MLKRGQVTIFLVVGIVILLVSALLFFILAKVEKESLEVEEKEATTFQWVKPAVQSYIENCMKETANPSVYLLAIQGGLIYPDEDGQILLTDYGMVNYAWLNGQEGISKEKMETDLAEYLETYIDFCLSNIETFTKQGIIIEPNYDKAKADFKIGTYSINIKLDLPVTVTYPNNDTLSVNTFSTQITSNLGKMIDTANSLNFPDVSPDDLIGLPYQPIIFPFDESVTIYSLTEENSKEPLSFMFAVRDDFPTNEAPILGFIPDKTFRVGNKWEEVLYADDSNNDILKFSSDSSKFPVSEDGTIAVELNEVGSFTITFTVEDGRGEKDEQEVTINILEAR